MAAAVVVVWIVFSIGLYFIRSRRFSRSSSEPSPITKLWLFLKSTSHPGFFTIFFFFIYYFPEPNKQRDPSYLLTSFSVWCHCRWAVAHHWIEFAKSFEAYLSYLFEITWAHDSTEHTHQHFDLFEPCALVISKCIHSSVDDVIGRN